MPEFRLPVYDAFKALREDTEVDLDKEEAFEVLRYSVLALDAFWLAALAGRGICDCGRITSPALSASILRFWAGSGTESRKPSTCNDIERNPQFDPCRFSPVVDTDEGGGMVARALFSDSERSDSALITLPVARADGCGNIDVCCSRVSWYALLVECGLNTFSIV